MCMYVIQCSLEHLQTKKRSHVCSGRSKQCHTTQSDSIEQMGLIVWNVLYNMGEEQLIEFSTSSSLLEIIG